ncbi:hypothetical protein [Lactobacillus brevis] [Lactiplantibacillus mudanjiangensis]|uniref:AAA family ATPase n=1 Tax=Lactiplantibacillus mudanjiangensis TaxID=1296538 RepID=UPI0010140EA3|nr:hypothetical protein [Lactobacillus brevis] [Lactiplantibacillus mudanjiangensis]
MQIIKSSDINMSNVMYLVYGRPGTGKTHAVQFLPGKTVYIAIDGSERPLKDKNTDNLILIVLDQSDYLDIITSMDKAMMTIEQSFLGKVDNVVLDNISYLQELIVEQLSDKYKDQRQMWQFMQNYIKKIVTRFKSWDKRIYVTGWEVDYIDFDESHNQTTLFDLKLNASLRESIEGLFNVVGRAFIHKEEHLIQLTQSQRIAAKNQVDTRKYCLTEDLFTDKEWQPKSKTITGGNSNEN